MKIWHLTQDNLELREFRKKREEISFENRNLPFKAGELEHMMVYNLIHNPDENIWDKL